MPDRLRLDRQDDRLVVTGEIDVHSMSLLDAELGVISSEGDVHLDMDGVTFIDSSGLRVLIDAHQRLAEGGGRLVLLRPSAVVVRLLDVSGLTGHLTVSDG